jgi:hypothetical protein
MWGTLQGVATPAVMFAGVYLGAPIIASEIERGTAVLPWTMGESRLRWLAPRVLLVGLWLTVFSMAIGLGLDRIHEIAVSPHIPITANLYDYEQRGWIVPARALVAFAAAILVGAVLGRALPALLAGLALSGVVVAGVLVIGSILNGTGVEPVGFNDGSIVNTSPSSTTRRASTSDGARQKRSSRMGARRSKSASPRFRSASPGEHPRSSSPARRSRCLQERVHCSSRVRSSPTAAGPTSSDPRGWLEDKLQRHDARSG